MCSSSFLLHCTEEQMICRNRYRGRQTESNRGKETTDDLQEFQQEKERDKCVEHNIKVRQRIRKNTEITEEVCREQRSLNNG